MSKLSFYVLKNQTTGKYVVNDELEEGAFEDACVFRDLETAEAAADEIAEMHKQETERCGFFFGVRRPPEPIALVPVRYAIKERVSKSTPSQNALDER